jgi:hypothetical protein
MSNQTSDRDPSPSPWQRPDDSPTAPLAVTPSTADTTRPSDAGAPLPPVTPVSRPKPVRWIVALLATALVVATGAGLAMLATGSRTTAAQGPTFLPPETMVYMETRLDLPGDQRENLIAFMGKFPGFADPAAFDLKVNDTLDRLTRESTQGEYSYAADIKPWFDGEVAIGITDVPELPGVSGDDVIDGAEVPDFVGSLSVADRAALEAFLVRLRADLTEATYVETAHGDVTIVTYQDHAAPDPLFSYAVTDESLLFAAQAADLMAALDVRSGAQPSLAGAAGFQERFAGLPSERLSALYVDLRGYRQVLESQLSEVDEATRAMFSDGLHRLPDSVAATLRVEGDRMVADMVWSDADGATTPTARSTSLAARMPSTSAFYLESRDVGQTIKTTVEQAMAQFDEMLLESQLEQVEDFLGAPTEDFLLWLEDTAVSVSLDGDQVSFGMAATITDTTIAAQRVERLTTAVRAAAAFGEVPFEIEEVDVAGSLVTTIQPVSDPSFPLPDDLPFEPSLSYGIHEDVFYLGMGDFVTDAMQQSESDSLAGNAAYSTALEASGGDTNTGVMYLDIASIRSFGERMVPDAERAEYDLEAKPYLEALDRFIMTGITTDGGNAARALLYVE